MSMEVNAKSMGGVGALLLFWGGGTKLSGNFEPCQGAGDSNEDEFCEELKPDRELESSSVTTGCLVEGALAPESREE